MIVSYGTRQVYLFSGSSDEGRDLKAPYLVQQQAIRDGQAAGCLSYDLWGIPLEAQPGDAGWGYAHFKAMLGGQPVRFVGRLGSAGTAPAGGRLSPRRAGRRPAGDGGMSCARAVRLADDACRSKPAAAGGDRGRRGTPSTR